MGIDEVRRFNVLQESADSASTPMRDRRRPHAAPSATPSIAGAEGRRRAAGRSSRRSTARSSSMAWPSYRCRSSTASGRFSDSASAASPISPTAAGFPTRRGRCSRASTSSCSTRSAIARTRRTSRWTKRWQRATHPPRPRATARTSVTTSPHDETNRALPTACAARLRRTAWLECAATWRGRASRAVSADADIIPLVEVAHFPDDARPPRWHQPVLALGNFDGLHRGHIKIIERVRRVGAERGGTSSS